MIPHNLGGGQSPSDVVIRDVLITLIRSCILLSGGGQVLFKFCIRPWAITIVKKRKLVYRSQHHSCKDRLLLRTMYIHYTYHIIRTEMRTICRWLISVPLHLCISTQRKYIHNRFWRFSEYSLFKHCVLLNQANCGCFTGSGGTGTSAAIAVPPELVKLHVSICTTIKCCMWAPYLKSLQDRILKYYRSTRLEVQY